MVYELIFELLLFIALLSKNYTFTVLGECLNQFWPVILYLNSATFASNDESGNNVKLFALRLFGLSVPQLCSYTYFLILAFSDLLF